MAELFFGQGVPKPLPRDFDFQKGRLRLVRIPSALSNTQQGKAEMAFRKNTVLRFLKAVAASPAGLSRSELYALSGRAYSAEKLNTLRTVDFPSGLKGLVAQRKSAGKGNRMPRTVWFITPKGQRLLRDLETNPDAMPVVVHGKRAWQPYTNYHFLSERRRKRNQHKVNQLKYDARLANPKFSGAEYREPASEELLQIEIGSAEFKALSPLERIRILRTKSGRN